jgi:ADP-ribose pyrophosphatase YjhB (NUDIX family)
MSRFNIWGYKGEVRDSLPIRIVGDFEEAKRDTDDSFDQGKHTKILVIDNAVGKVVYAREVQYGAHCTYCGKPMGEQSWPKKCPSPTCGHLMYLNPVPVVVTLVPVEVWTGSVGLLIIQRGIQPGRGLWALPGGYMDAKEQWQDASAREVFEEVKLRVHPDKMKLSHLVTSSNGRLLVFGVTETVPFSALQDFRANEEVLDIKVIHQAIPLVFPLHTEAAERFFRSAA